MRSTGFSAAWQAIAALALMGSVSTSRTAVVAQANRPDGQALFQKLCSSCHTGTAESRAPTLASLRERAPAAVVEALTAGAMRYQGFHLSGAEKRAVAEFITGRKMTGDPVGATVGRCSSAMPPFVNPFSSASWNGWSPSSANLHFQPAARAGLTPAQVPHLTLKWAIGFPDVTITWSQPTVVGGRVFIGSQGGVTYSLDAESGCIHWAFTTEAGVRTSVSIGRYKGSDVYAAYFADTKGIVYAVNAATGKLLWKRDVEDHPLVRMTGSPTLYNGVLYVPVSSFEESVAAMPSYPCCTFRGKVVALDVGTGSVNWIAYTIDEPKPLGKSPQGVQLWGPSGAAVWSSPTIDPKRGVMYVVTGNGYSAPVQKTTDALLAFDLATGKLRWSRQIIAEVYGCRPELPNCVDRGPDYDFGATPVLATTASGKDVIIAGQKSGIGYALDPDKQGEIIWQYRAGEGDITGGIVWGTAADADNAYFPVSDQSSARPGGVHAVTLDSGERVWHAPPASPKCTRGRGCNSAQPVAITVIPGVLFAGSNDGGFRAYSTRDGSIIWDFDTNRAFDTVNGVPAKGASMIGPGPAIAGGMVYVNSGYGAYGGRPGNVLLAFGIN